jgi:hypothetical protein
MEMSCTEFKAGHPLGSAQARAHRAACPDCSLFAQAWEILREYPAIEPGTGFFRAVRRKLAPRILRFAAGLSAAAAALLVALVLWHTPAAKPDLVTDEERELVENLDLLQNYDLLKTVELVGEYGSSLVEEKK